MNRRELQRLAGRFGFKVEERKRHLVVLTEDGFLVATVSKGTGGYGRGSRALRNFRAAIRRGRPTNEEGR